MIKEKTHFQHFIILTRILAKLNFKQQSQGKILGRLWHVLNPLLAFSTLFIIFAGPTGKDIAYFPLYLLLGIIIFNIFLQTTNSAVSAIRENRGVILSVNFPQESLISSLTLNHLFVHIIEMIIFAIGLIIMKLPLTMLLVYPLIMTGIGLFTYGVALLVSAIAVYVLDIELLWHHGVRLAWFATPIFYAYPQDSFLLQLNYWLNPMYQYITIARNILIEARAPETPLIILATAYTVGVLIIGTIVFKKAKHKFAEIV